MFQDERIVRRPVQVRNKLDVILQGLVRELLQFGGRECVRLDDGRRAFVLEVPLQFDGESVKFEKCRLAQCALEVVEVFEVMSVVPIDDAEFEVGPIHDFAFRQPKASPLRLQQLNEGLHAIKKSCQSVRGDSDGIFSQGDLVGLLREGALIAVGCVANGDGVGENGEPQDGAWAGFAFRPG